MRARHWLVSGLAAAATACGSGSAPDEAAPADEPGATITDAAVERLAAAYAELGGLLERNPGEAMQWAEADIENLGDWEYRIVELGDSSPESLAAELNALGDERWEAYWVESRPGGLRVFLKRSSISYLSRLPLSSLARLLAGGNP